jgi:uncharacterized iron-regulated protein
MHETPAVHELHHAIVRELHGRRPDMVIALEMFERDAQTPLLQYLAGVSDERDFLAAARPWRTYERDYRPLVQFAKEKGLVVIAANAPRELASRVAKEGIGSIAGERLSPRETTAPEDDYWDAFQEAMKEGAHGAPKTGAKPETADEANARLHRYYEAQCLRDDTMAESIVDHLRERETKGSRPLCVLVCGRQHSDFGRGVVARIRSRMPELTVRVLSAQTVPDLADGMYATPKTMADHVILVEGAAEPSRHAAPSHVAVAPVAPLPVASGGPAGPAGPGKNPHGTAGANPPAGAGAGAGAGGGTGRPALGLMPDYENKEGKGVLVANVREGGSAFNAGIEPGDYIVNVGGLEVTDVESYTEALDQQVVGKTITVRIRRDDAEVDLQVVVAARAR